MNYYNNTKRGLQIKVPVVLIVMQIAAAAAMLISNSINLIDALLLIIATAISSICIGQYPLMGNLAKYIVFFTYWISLIFLPGFHMVKNIARYYKITQIDYDRLSAFGPKVYIIAAICFFVFGSLSKNNKSRNRYVFTPKPISPRFINIAFVIIFLLSLFSLSIGLGRMGGTAVRLPFNLSGIINLLRISFFPALFGIYVENKILRKKNVPTYQHALFFAWSILEVFVRLSKGALLSNYMVLGIIYLIYFRPSLKVIVRRATPLVVIFLFLYPIVENMRHYDSNVSFSERFSMARGDVEDNEDGNDRLLTPINRTFMIPMMYVKDYNYVDHFKMFDFSKAPVLMAMGGSARYQTFGIDGYPPGIAHSSGTTGLQDPLLFGGYGLCYIMVVLFMFVAMLIDGISSKRYHSIYVRLVLLIWGWANTQNISIFFDGVSLNYLLVTIIVLIITYNYNFRKKVNLV